MTSPAVPNTPAPTESSLPFEAPEFSLLQGCGTLKIPLTTNRAAPSAPIEVDAAHVKRGQHLPVDPIEAAAQALAPNAGTTRSGCEVMLFGGQSVPAVEFVCDAGPMHAEELVKPVENAERFDSIRAIQKEDLGAWIERFRDAGIHADRRSSPDLLQQLTQAMKRPVDMVLCSILDSDPTACPGAALARQFSNEIVAGTLLIQRIVAAPQAMICADQRLPANWLSGIRKVARKTPARLITMVNDYPQADPTLLLYTLQHRRLRPGRLPVELGTIVLDAAAAFAIGRRFLADEPMTHVPLVIRNHARKLSHFVMAPIGLPLVDLLATIGETDGNMLIRGGDLLRDLRITREAVVSGSELVVHTSDPEPDINPDACIRCGWCIEACPTRVSPAVVLESAQSDDIDLAERAGIEACIDCGICSYVCPSKLPLLESIRVMKQRHDV